VQGIETRPSIEQSLTECKNVQAHRYSGTFVGVYVCIYIYIYIYIYVLNLPRAVLDNMSSE
jgi:hypothetical protein